MRFEIEWGISGSADDQRVRDVTLDGLTEAEALALAKSMAEDLYESNKPTIWWKAKPYRDKQDNEQPTRDRIPSDGALRHVDPVGCGSGGGE